MSRIGLFLTFSVLCAAACGTQRPEMFNPSPGSADDDDRNTAPDVNDNGDVGPPPADTPGLCGNDILTAVEDPPNLYFVLDRSGSMFDSMDELPGNKLDASRDAIETALQAIGHRVQYGAAVFPSNSDDGCAAGREVFRTQRGDSVAATEGTSGPTLRALMSSLESYAPNGGTPAAATLRALSGPLSYLAGTTYILLFTDGGPNCNSSAQCESDACIPDIERIELQSGEFCGSDLLCCADPAFVDPGSGCIDETAVQAIADLQASGVSTYVIGLPGAGAYADVLSRMAAAGGVARTGNATEAYYAVDSIPELVETLSAITLNLALSCDIELSAPPPDPTDVNVYFDDELLESNEENGWVYTSESTIQLRGEACDALMSGAIRKVQIVAGCPTVVR